MDHNKSTSEFRKKVWLTTVIVAFMVILFLMFKALFSLLLLVLEGILMCVFFHGCAGIIKKNTKIGHPYALIISILLNFIIVGLFFWFVGARLSSQIDSLSETLPHTIENAKTWLSERPVGNKILDYATNSIDSGKTSATVKSFFSSTFGILSDLYIVLLLGLFFTASPDVYRRGVMHLVPVNAKETAEKLWDKIHHVLKNWLKGQIFGFFFIAVLSGLGLWLLGVPLVLTLALVAGLLNFIPNFGPLIALVPAVLLGLMQGTNTALLVIGLYTCIQIIQSAVTQPLIQKKMVSVPPGLLVFGQIAMGLLSGFWGVLLATPIVAIIMTLVNKLYVEKQSHQKEQA